MIARKMIFLIALPMLQESHSGKKLFTAGDFNDHLGSNPENYDEQHGDYGYGVRNKKGERILEFCTAKNMIVGNTVSKKRSPSYMSLAHQKLRLIV